MTMTRVTLLVACVCALSACENPPTMVANRCVADWPAVPPGGDPLAAPVSAAAPPGTIVMDAVLTKSIATALLVTPDRLYMTAGGRVYVMNHDAQLIASHVSAGYEGVGAPVTDEGGNVYFAGESIYSVDKQGAWRYIVPLDDAAPQAGRSLLFHDGTLFTAAGDGYLYALDAATGARKWRREVGKNVNGPAVLLGGVAGAVMAITRGATPSSRLYDVATGAPLATFTTPKGDPEYGLMFGRALGIVTQRMDDTTGPYPWMHIAVLDPCSKPRFTIEPTRPQWPALIAPGDELLVVERDDVRGSQTFVSGYGPDGTKLIGPVPAATPWAVGADGTIYGLTCDSPGVDGPSRLIAYDPQLHEQWRLELGPSCPITTPVIGDDGRLYFARYAGGATELIGVQTTSPGLASSSWPTRRHDAHGTGWLE